MVEREVEKQTERLFIIPDRDIKMEGSFLFGKRDEEECKKVLS